MCNGDDNCSGSFLAQDIQQGSSKHDFKGSKFFHIFVGDFNSAHRNLAQEKIQGKKFLYQVTPYTPYAKATEVTAIKHILIAYQKSLF